MTDTIATEERAARAIPCPYCGSKPGEPCLGMAVSHIERRAAATAHSEPEAPEHGARSELYITFGVQYAREDHPAGDWVHPDGYLVVEYSGGSLGALDANGQPMADPRERARLTAWAWLGGRWAFDYDVKPSPLWYPKGEIARMVLP